MTERVFQLDSVRVGRTDLGSGMLTASEEGLVLTIRGERDDQPLRIGYASIARVNRDAHEVAIALRDGSTIFVIANEDVRDELLARCQTVPELTRTLRSFGSRRGRRAEPSDAERASRDQRRFFAPLLDARRVASSARGAAAVRAFDAREIGRVIDATLHAFACERHAQPGPARRALEAELCDLTEPLKLALEELAHTGSEASAEPDDLKNWRAWSAQLRVTFETADRVWVALDAVLVTIPSAVP